MGWNHFWRNIIFSQLRFHGKYLKLFEFFCFFCDINVSFEKNAQRLEWNFRNDFILLSENWLPPPGSSNLPDKSGSDQDHVKTESMKTLGKHLFPTYCIIEIFRIHVMTFLVRNMDYRCPIKPFFIEIQNFWAWADKLGRLIFRHLGYYWPNYQQLSASILVQWVPCPCFSLFNHGDPQECVFKLVRPYVTW
jgi:hypothetical protein